MPLNGHQYLASQGWRGKGTGLRDGAITRPLAIPQKKNLAGVGKDRDEAFPFWDHLFTAAAKSIQLKCSSDSEGESNIENLSSAIRRTTTGIISNRRPVEGTPATSDPSNSSKPRINLLATAKRDAAKQNLYSRFFRGPVLGPGDEEQDSSLRDTTQIEHTIDATPSVENSGNTGIDSKVEGRKSKRKRDLGDEDPQKQKKRRKKRGDGVEKSKVEKRNIDDELYSKATASRSLDSIAEAAPEIDSGSGRKRRKEEKARLKLEKKKRKLECRDETAVACDFQAVHDHGRTP